MKKVLLIATMLMVVPTVPAQATVLEESDQVFPVQDMPPGALLAPPCERWTASLPPTHRARTSTPTVRRRRWGR